MSDPKIKPRHVTLVGDSGPEFEATEYVPFYGYHAPQTGGAVKRVEGRRFIRDDDGHEIRQQNDGTYNIGGEIFRVKD